MAKERLSKLQKWVLMEAYKNYREHETSLGKLDIYELSKQDIYERFFDVKITRGPWDRTFRLLKKDKVKAVILSRSLRRLKEKGYVKAPNEFLAKMFKKSAHCAPALELTDKGVEIAKSIIAHTVMGNYTLRAED